MLIPTLRLFRITTSDIIEPVTDSLEKTDANIDATCHRTHYSSNRLTCLNNNQLNKIN